MLEPYSIPTSFLKLIYLKTELNVDNDTYAIVKLRYHSYRKMINLSIPFYFELMWHPLRTYLAMFRFFGKMSRLTIYLKIKLYHVSIHVSGKVQGPTSMGNLHDEYCKVRNIGVELLLAT